MSILNIHVTLKRCKKVNRGRKCNRTEIPVRLSIAQKQREDFLPQ